MIITTMPNVCREIWRFERLTETNRIALPSRV
jgi:hypothetical protein